MAGEARRVSRELRQFVARAVARVATNVTARLIKETPVDTGWARANWIPAVGAPVDAPAGTPGDASSAQGAQQAGLNALAGYTDLSQGQITISNNVPYIQRLNDGSSQQAPAGFVEQAIEDGIRDST